MIAITIYREIIDACDGVNPVTQNLAVTVLADEEDHRTLFAEFLQNLAKGK